jgi:hypothetical protein
MAGAIGAAISLMLAFGIGFVLKRQLVEEK